MVIWDGLEINRKVEKEGERNTQKERYGGVSPEEASNIAT